VTFLNVSGQLTHAEAEKQLMSQASHTIASIPAHLNKTQPIFRRRTYPARSRREIFSKSLSNAIVAKAFWRNRSSFLASAHFLPRRYFPRTNIASRIYCWFLDYIVLKRGGLWNALFFNIRGPCLLIFCN
jgi:hypothetical protein